MGNATGIFNLLRNIGGSIGISMAQTILTRRSALHQSQIASSVPASNYWYQQRVQELSGYLAHHLGTASARPAAMGRLYAQLERQALLWSFVDVFRWTAVLTFLAAGLVWLFPKIVHRQGPPSAAH